MQVNNLDTCLSGAFRKKRMDDFRGDRAAARRARGNYFLYVSTPGEADAKGSAKSTSLFSFTLTWMRGESTLSTHHP
jgi:hypothetical protein